jgi:hypothetical protein
MVMLAVWFPPMVQWKALNSAFEKGQSKLESFEG